MTKRRLDIAGLEGSDLRDEAYADLLAQNDPPVLFQRASRLVRLYRDEEGPPRAVEHGSSSLRDRLADVAHFGRLSQQSGNWTPAMPPIDVAKLILARGQYPDVPVLDRVVDAPVYQADGARLERAGYAAASRTWYEPAVCFLKKSDLMSTHDALEIVDEVLCDFPFKGEADYANAMALMLTPLVRDLVTGPTPMHLITAARPGAGKTLLAQAALAPICGTVALTSVSSSEEERKKALFALLRSGAPAVVLDNLAGAKTLDSPSLAQALTAEVYQDRLLGSSRVESFRVRNAWAATVNKPTLSFELMRRCVLIELGIPAQDRRYRHADLLTWVHMTRSGVTAALTSLVEAWKRDDGEVWRPWPTLNSYEMWGRVIGGILDTARVPGFMANIDRLREQTTEPDDDSGLLLELLRREFGGEPFRGVDVAARTLSNPMLRTALGERDAANGRAVGQMLQARKDEPADGLILRRVGRQWVIRNARGPQ